MGVDGVAHLWLHMSHQKEVHMPKFYVEYQEPGMDDFVCREVPSARAAREMAKRASARLQDLAYALRDDDGTGYTGQAVYYNGYLDSKEGAPIKDAA
jgi:hypothetical protein